MAGVAGNVYTLTLAKQTAKGTPAGASSGYKLKLTGGDLSPARQLLTLQETDATRQQGPTVVVGAHVEGIPQFYCRPSDFGLLAYAALGANVDAGGTAATFTHTATPAQAPPYLTAYKNIGNGVLVDRYQDLRVRTMEISGGAGQALMVKPDFLGTQALFGTTDSNQAVTTERAYVYPDVSVALGGAYPATVESFTIMLNNNAEIIQADTQIYPYDVILGRLDVTGTFVYLFESDADYRRFHTGTAGGSVFTTTLFQEALNIHIGNPAASQYIDITLAGIALTAYPVLPDVSGKPIRVAATFSSMPQAAIASYVQITTGNGVASY